MAVAMDCEMPVSSASISFDHWLLTALSIIFVIVGGTSLDWCFKEFCSLLYGLLIVTDSYSGSSRLTILLFEAVVLLPSQTAREVIRMPSYTRDLAADSCWLRIAVTTAWHDCNVARRSVTCEESVTL